MNVLMIELYFAEYLTGSCYSVWLNNSPCNIFLIFPYLVSDVQSRQTMGTWDVHKGVENIHAWYNVDYE